LKALIVLQLTQLADSKLQLSITLFENAYFLTFSLNLFLNSLWSCPSLSPSSSWKNNSYRWGHTRWVTRWVLL